MKEVSQDQALNFDDDAFDVIDDSCYLSLSEDSVIDIFAEDILMGDEFVVDQQPRGTSVKDSICDGDGDENA